MKKKLFAVLACMMLLLAVSAPAYAGDMAHFQKTETYSDTVFSDVAASAWYAPNVQSCYEYSLMNGAGGKFNPTGNLTVAEAIVMADRVYQIYETGANTLTNGTPWYQTYVDYAMEVGLIQAGDFTDFNRNITRAEMAYLFAAALPAEELPAINNITALPDVTAANPYYDSILALYQAGVLTGNDVYGTFTPNAGITRAEAATIISRVAVPENRKTVELFTDCKAGAFGFALPANMEQYTDDEGGAYYLGETGCMYVVSAYDSAFADMRITDVSIEEMAEIFFDNLEEGGTNVAVKACTQVNFGSIPMYRLVYTAYDNDVAMECVSYLGIFNSCLHEVDIMFIDGATANAVANTLTVNGVKGN